MSHRREYEIAFVGLKPGVHVYEYRIEDKFFVPYGEQDFQNCMADVKLSLDKNNGFMQLKFDIGGTVDVNCDRCGNTLVKQLWDEFNIIVKMVEEPEVMNEQEEDPDVYYISRGESHITVADWLYEFINLSIPFQKMCPEDEIGGPQCNKEVLEKLKQMEDNVKKDSNPLWKGLEKFKDLE
ncbi:YceD family protein [Chitinophagaceae bacterium LWZ2-11]